MRKNHSTLKNSIMATHLPSCYARGGDGLRNDDIALGVGGDHGHCSRIGGSSALGNRPFLDEAADDPRPPDEQHQIHEHEQAQRQPQLRRRHDIEMPSAVSSDTPSGPVTDGYTTQGCAPPRR